MGFREWLYFGFTALLALAFALVIIYYVRGKRKDRVESPKYRMMEDDAQAPKSKRQISNSDQFPKSQ
jgi:cbb3-type cytochrome oxidase subunit 3